MLKLLEMTGCVLDCDKAVPLALEPVVDASQDEERWLRARSGNLTSNRGLEAQVRQDLGTVRPLDPNIVVGRREGNLDLQRLASCIALGPLGRSTGYLELKARLGVI